MMKDIALNQPQPVPQVGEPTVFRRRYGEDNLLPDTGELQSLYDHIRMLDAPTYPASHLEYGEFTIDFSDAILEGHHIQATVKIRKRYD